MMAAMILPGAAPAILRRCVPTVGRSVPLFVASYLAVCAVVGVAVYALYRPHGSPAAGVVTIAAGGYELTPLKRRYLPLPMATVTACCTPTVQPDARIRGRGGRGGIPASHRHQQGSVTAAGRRCVGVIPARERV